MRRPTPLANMFLTACQAAGAKVDPAANPAAPSQFERLQALCGAWTVEEGAERCSASR